VVSNAQKKLARGHESKGGKGELTSYEKTNKWDISKHCHIEFEDIWTYRLHYQCHQKRKSEREDALNTKMFRLTFYSVNAIKR
jgi:hypothetical protein